MKLIDYIVVAFSVFIIFEGFTGEFHNPTTFDIIKWICFACMIILSYLFYKKRGSTHV